MGSRTILMCAQITVVGQTGTPTIQQYLDDSFRYRYSSIKQVVAILLGFTIFFAGLAIGARKRAARAQATCTVLSHVSRQYLHRNRHSSGTQVGSST